MATKAQKAKPAAKTSKERPSAKGPAPKTKPARVVKGKVVKAKPTLDFSSLYTDTMDDIARRQGVECSSMDSAPPMSSGMLEYDLMLGGGIRPAFYTSAGQEQSAKTTKALTIMASAIKMKIPLIEWWDYEGSTRNSRPYVLSIVRGAGVKVTSEELFGKKDADGKYIIRPIVRYHNESVLEKFFDYVSEVLRKLPDKKYINKKWWMIFEDNKVNKAKYEEFADKTMPKKYGKGIWLEAPDGNLQGIIFADSWAAMNPAGNDDEEANKSLALQARAFAQNLPRVKGRLADKMVAIVGTNLLSDIPMAMFGPKEQEIGGKRLRGLSDVRNRNTSVASSQPLWPKNFNKAFEEVEHSVEFEGGIDRYRYVKSKAIKNKLWTPGRTGWFRVWIEDGSGKARGFDPFFDTMYYLRQTGQLIGKGRNPSKTGGGGLILNLEGLGKTKVLKWSEYKTWVLGTREQMVAICKKVGLKKPMSLRAFCFKQMADGTAERLYVEHSESDAKMDDKGGA